MSVQTREVAGSDVDSRRRDIVRLLAAPVELRAPAAAGNGSAGDGTTMFGHFAVFNRWTEIDSVWEGRFLEQIAPGAFTKTFRENRGSMRVLVEHGHDPMMGNRALGPIDKLSEDATGAYYEVPLVDASDVRDLILPRLRAALYGASFRFRVMREEIVDDPEASADNPHGLQERTIKEVQVMEFGPVTFPAYADATAGVRSICLTDEHVAAARAGGDILAEVEGLARAAGLELDPALVAAILGGARSTSTSNNEAEPDEPDEPDTEQDAAPEPERATTPRVKGLHDPTHVGKVKR